MTAHLDTLRRMRDARPSHRCGGCELCRERAALEEAIRVMEREAALLALLSDIRGALIDSYLSDDERAELVTRIRPFAGDEE